MMIQSPFVSVVIATYNYGRFLPDALDSVRAQTFSDYEILVVDDGSTDDTETVIARYLADPRIRFLRIDHLGQPAAKNTGIRHARGQYVAFLDADDRWLPTKLEKQVALFRAEPDLGVVYSRWRAIDERGRSIPDWARPVHRGDVLGQLFRRNFVCFSSSVVRTTVFADIGCFDERIPLSIDYDLWLRIALKYPFDYVDEPLAEYRTGHVNLSRRALERLDCIRIIMNRFLDEYGGRERLDRALVRRTWGEYYCDLAWVVRARSILESVYWYARAVAVFPWLAAGWWGLLASWWPEGLKASIRRRVLGSEGRAKPVAVCNPASDPPV
jgi:glycosyltransferase involved in cell wall biosynthesis